MTHIQKLTVKGYKSIAALVDFELRPLNVLIGANGAGKSNFIGLFRFLASVVGDNFAVDVQKRGGPETLLHYGSKVTPQMSIDIRFSGTEGVTGVYENGYRITLAATQDNRLIFAREEPTVRGAGYASPKVYSLGAGHDTARIRSDKDSPSATVSRYVLDKLQIWRQYHFHDTGDTAAVKRIHAVNDNLRLKPDAANLAAYLRKLKTTPIFESSYDRIVETIRRVAPFFGDFLFRDDAGEFIELEWTERGRPDTPWKAHVLSDGTLRFICLTTLLLQPKSLLPDTLLIDEPELGLHPFAINLLADMLQEAAESKQVIVSTQSVELLNAFQPEDVVVVQREEDASVFKRLDKAALSDWLADDYSLGELWKRNILGGRPGS
ncbi:AAA family ATPase [Rhizobacter sp. OV335]|uniref:AAA family ATPase n=1 Tax=Rhizobacter sp. OV335 TaxID=1500264 RepID=UPI000913876E|nr:AAA family ATPase [Rhizobacter sp. OV335]SHL97543.1 Predicted ATPase [Rhizobacter sp. OV335]